MSKSIAFLGRASAAAAALISVSGVAHAGEAGWYGQLETVFLKPHASEGAVNRPIDFGYEPGVRAIVGYQDASGFGARARVFNYDQSAGTASQNLTLARTVIDLEATQAFGFDHGQINFAAGLRYVDSEHATDGFSVEYNAWGLTAALEGQREVGPEGLALTASARWAAVYGNTDYRTVGGGVFSSSDDVHNSLELRFGPEYTFTAAGRDITVGAGATAEALNNDAFGDTQDSGFFGYYLNIGTRF